MGNLKIFNSKEEASNLEGALIDGKIIDVNTTNHYFNSLADLFFRGKYTRNVDESLKCRLNSKIRKVGKRLNADYAIEIKSTELSFDSPNSEFSGFLSYHYVDFYKI